MKYCVIEINESFIVCHGSGLDWNDAHLLVFSGMLDDCGNANDKKLQNVSLFELEANDTGLGVVFEVNGMKNEYYILEDPGNIIETYKKEVEND